MLRFLQRWGSFVKFSHTVFALPFALAAMVVALLVVGIDTMVLNVALPTLATQLGAKRRWKRDGAQVGTHMRLLRRAHGAVSTCHSSRCKQILSSAL